MELALFDLDKTLISGDSEICWLEHLKENQLCDFDIQEKIQSHLANYEQGILDTDQWQQVLIGPMLQFDADKQSAIRQDFIEKKIKPLVRPLMADKVAHHQAQGHQTIIISATNQFLAKPIQSLFSVDAILSTPLELNAGTLTAKVKGRPCFRDGKIYHLLQHLQTETLDSYDIWFYSDSHNDLPLLQLAQYPVAVTPDAKLLKVAQDASWEIINFETTPC